MNNYRDIEEELVINYFDTEDFDFQGKTIRIPSPNSKPLDLNPINCSDRKLDLKLEFPKNIVWTKWKNIEYVRGDCYSYLCIDIPQEYYLKHYIQFDLLYYNNKEHTWYSYDENTDFLQDLIDSVAKNGFFCPPCLTLTSQGQLYPLSCRHKLLTSRYLNLPSIPAIILTGIINIPEGTIDCRNLANKYLSPYIVYP